MSNSNDNDSALAWSSSGTVSLTNSASRFTSDAKAIHADAVSGSLRVLADNAGTPSSGDTIDLWVSWSPDGSNFDTDEHASWLGRLNTYGAEDPGEDPVAKTFPLNVSGKQSFKLVARGNLSSLRNITLSAIYNEHRMA